MKPLLKTFKNWFGFERRERRASFILLFITLIIFLLRYVVPEKNLTLVNLSDDPELRYLLSENFAVPGIDSIRLFPFDPNTATYDTLVMLGLTGQQARTLISYRNKGGIFRSPRDITRIYGIDLKTAGTMIPYIRIREEQGIRHPEKKGRDKLIIELNSTDSLSLQFLPGIGPVLSARIIRYRNLLGGYASVDQLKEVYGLTDETFGRISGSLRVDTLLLKKTDPGKATFRDLIRIPYLDRYEVESILKFRNMGGTITGIYDLVENKLIREDIAAKIRPYLQFDK
jgi:DNA uptake protein ComE-like DNA-binding protein